MLHFRLSAIKVLRKRNWLSNTKERNRMKLIGGLIFALGVFLWCGNVIGFFPTFPLAGYLTMVAGGFVMRLDNKS
jgi:hypothetical protein